MVVDRGVGSFLSFCSIRFWRSSSSSEEDDEVGLSIFLGYLDSGFSVGPNLEMLVSG